MESMSSALGGDSDLDEFGGEDMSAPILERWNAGEEESDILDGRDEGLGVGVEVAGAALRAAIPFWPAPASESPPPTEFTPFPDSTPENPIEEPHTKSWVAPPASGKSFAHLLAQAAGPPPPQPAITPSTSLPLPLANEFAQYESNKLPAPSSGSQESSHNRLSTISEESSQRGSPPPATLDSAPQGAKTLSRASSSSSLSSLASDSNDVPRSLLRSDAPPPPPRQTPSPSGTPQAPPSPVREIQDQKLRKMPVREEDALGRGKRMRQASTAAIEAEATKSPPKRPKVGQQQSGSQKSTEKPLELGQAVMFTWPDYTSPWPAVIIDRSEADDLPFALVSGMANDASILVKSLPTGGYWAYAQPSQLSRIDPSSPPSPGRAWPSTDHPSFRAGVELALSASNLKAWLEAGETDLEWELLAEYRPSPSVTTAAKGKGKGREKRVHFEDSEDEELESKRSRTRYRSPPDAASAWVHGPEKDETTPVPSPAPPSIKLGPKLEATFPASTAVAKPSRLPPPQITFAPKPSTPSTQSQPSSSSLDRQQAQGLSKDFETHAKPFSTPKTSLHHQSPPKVAQPVSTKPVTSPTAKPSQPSCTTLRLPPSPPSNSLKKFPSLSLPAPPAPKSTTNPPPARPPSSSSKPAARAPISPSSASSMSVAPRSLPAKQPPITYRQVTKPSNQAFNLARPTSKPFSAITSSAKPAVATPSHTPSKPAPKPKPSISTPIFKTRAFPLPKDTEPASSALPPKAPAQSARAIAPLKKPTSSIFHKRTSSHKSFSTIATASSSKPAPSSSSSTSDRFPIGSPVLHRWVGYPEPSPGVVCDPSSAAMLPPSLISGTRTATSYFLKCIPTGAYWTWAAPSTVSRLDLSAAPLARLWNKSDAFIFRQGVKLGCDSKALTKWLELPTVLELEMIAEAKRKKR